MIAQKALDEAMRAYLETQRRQGRAVDVTQDRYDFNLRECLEEAIEAADKARGLQA